MQKPPPREEGAIARTVWEYYPTRGRPPSWENHRRWA